MKNNLQFNFVMLNLFQHLSEYCRIYKLSIPSTKLPFSFVGGLLPSLCSVSQESPESAGEHMLSPL